MEFQKASKEQAKLRLAIFGPSGSGKTFTSLRLATGLGGEIAVIDTERGSASKYADRFAFDVLELHGKERDIVTYCQAIAKAQAAGYKVLIIDSLTHAWHELLGEVDRIARAKYRGNTWSAWSEGTPKQRSLVDAILGFDGHIIATMRTKTEWTTQTDGKGKTRPVRVGLAPEQGKGIEYEFDILMELTPEHDANIIKDRTGKYQDESITMPGEDLGTELAAWLKEGMAPRKRKKRAQTKKAAPKSNGNRPLAPDVLKGKLHTTAASKPDTHQEVKASDKQRGLAVAKLNECFANDDADDRRHAVTGWLFDKPSIKDLTMAEAGAILDWLLDKDADEGTYDLHPKASQEAEAVYREAMKNEGQSEMGLEEAQ